MQYSVDLNDKCLISNGVHFQLVRELLVAGF